MKWLTMSALFAVIAVSCAAQAPQSSDYERIFHSAVPLGAERIDLRPSRSELYLLATAQSPQFEGWHVKLLGDRKVLLSADGQRVRYYPDQVSFRLTATAMRPKLLMIDSYGTLSIPERDINDYLLGLGFRLLVFRGLDVTTVQPQNVRMIGVPADVPYEERIYNISFDLPRSVSTDERMVLEVLSPTGVRLCKFHLDFY